MPIYQYDCAGCDRRVDVFFRSVSKATNPTCPECGSKKLSRVMSKFARAKTDQQRLEGIDLAREQGKLEDGDVGSFAKWARQAGSEYDEQLGTNYRELAEKAEAGEDPVERIDAGYGFNYKVQEKKQSLSLGSGDPSASSDAD